MPSSVTTRLPARSRVALRITVVAPPTTAVWTPGVGGHRRESRRRASATRGVRWRRRVGLAWNVMPASDTSTTERTSRSIGVTDSPPTSRRRVPRSWPVVTSRPSGSNAGTPGTRSTHSSSYSLAMAARFRRWRCRRATPSCCAGRATGRASTSPASVQSTVATYGKNSRSQSTSTRRAVEPEHVQRDGGVVGPCRRVADRSCGLARRGRVGDHPFGDGRLVDAARRDRGAVGAPPVAAEAAHLLGGDEVGAAPRHRSLRVASSGPSPASGRDRPSSSPMRSCRPHT